MSAETQNIDTIYDVDEADFERRVLERSRELPVVVDFWADWCGPCKQLTPVLERAATARAGKVELAKVDVEKNRGLQAAFRIQGIPAVKAFRDGRVAAEFTGALPPAQVESFFDSLVPSEADELAASGEEGDLRRALELDPNHPTARRELGRLLLGAAIAKRRSSCSRAPRATSSPTACSHASSWRTIQRSPPAFEAWDAGDRAGALERLQEALAARPIQIARTSSGARWSALFTELRPGRRARARAPAPPVGRAELS